MATPLSIRLSDAERSALESEARRHGLALSTYARLLLRRAVGLEAEQQSEGSDVLEDHERRLSRLEEMAGL